MSTVERKEYQETKILRTRSPGRNFRSSSENLTEFNHNLDYLLEDLQNSVSRPGSSIGNYKDTRTNSLNRIKNVHSSNPLNEYSSDDTYNYTTPDGKHVSGYKKESYYKSASSLPVTEKRMQNNINQLDNLLDDLQQVKQSSYQSSYEREAYNNTGLDPDFHDGKALSSQKTVNRELHYGDTPKSTARSRTLERYDREGTSSREYQYSSEGTYGQVRTTSPAPSSRTSTLSKQTKVQNVHSYPMEVVETTAPDIDPEVLAHLDPNLHPPGNTKVTTTIKTYTYEIPGAGDYPTNLSLDNSQIQNEKYIYSPNTNTTITTPSKSFTYSKIENKENILNDHRLENYNYKEKEIYQNNKYYQKPAPPISTPAPTAGQTVVKETITTRNYQPGYIPKEPPPSSQSYVYNETVTTKSHDNYVPTTRTDALYIEEKDIIEYPPPQPTAPSKQIYYKETKDQSTNTLERYPNGHPPNDYSKSIYKEETRSNYKQEPVNIQYKYKSESKTFNNYKAGYPGGGETEPLIPKPFPTDASDGPGGPPKKLDELMKTIGGEPPNSPYNAGYTAHEYEMQQKRKVESLKQQSEADDMQKKEPVQRSKNVTGPPVYYPPGHEMFAKKEESGAAWRAEGAYARGSGKYEYEAESKSKQKMSSGKAIVPVCLPLCCGLPCAIL